MVSQTDIGTDQLHIKLSNDFSVSQQRFQWQNGSHSKWGKLNKTTWPIDPNMNGKFARHISAIVEIHFC